MLRLLLFLAALAAFVWFGATVKLGKHTLFGHVSRIWNTDEAKDLKDGVKEKSAPLVDKARRGARAAYEEVRRPPDGGKPQPARE